MSPLQTTLLYALNYIPPIVVAVVMYRKMKERYKRPLHQGTDIRVYLITIFSAALTLLFMTLLLYFLVSAFYVPYS